MKKLLAVVLSAAMVLGMTTMAMAEDIKAEPTFKAEGRTLYVDVAGAFNTIEGAIDLPEGAEVEASGVVKELKQAVTDLDDMTGTPIANIEGGQFLYAGAFISSKGDPMNYTGHAFYITFAADTSVTLPDGTVIDLKEAQPTEAPSEAPATDAPASEAPASEAPASEAPASEAPASEAPASQAPASQAPASQAPASQAPAGTGSTGSTGTSAGAGSAKAAKTADVAPVATMAVLALAAAAVVVSMKKKVTE